MVKAKDRESKKYSALETRTLSASLYRLFRYVHGHAPKPRAKLLETRLYNAIQ